MTPFPPPVVLAFNTCCEAKLASRMHAPGCVSLNRGKGAGRGKVRLHAIDTQAELDATVEDLNERGFTVGWCKCLKKGAP